MKKLENKMHKKIIKLGLVLFIASLLFTRCVDTPNDVVLPSWNVKLHVPVTEKEYTLQQAIEKDTTFVNWYKEGTNMGLLYFADSQPIQTVSIGDNLAINPFSVSQSEVIGPLTVDFPTLLQTGIYVEDWTTDVQTGSNQVFREQEGNVKIGFQGIANVKSIKLDAGTMTVTVINHLPVDIQLRGLKIQNAIDQSVIAEVPDFPISNWIDIPKEVAGVPGFDTLSFPIAGKVVSDSIEYVGKIYSPGSNGVAVQIPEGAGTQIATVFNNLVIGEATAILPEQNISFQNSVIFDDSTKLKQAVIHSGSAQLKITNNIAVDLNAKISLDNLLDAAGNQYTLNVFLAKNENQKLINLPDLAGWKLVSTNGIPTNKFNFSVDVNTNSTQDYVTVSENDSIGLSVDFSKILFESLEGQLKPTLYALQPSQIHLDLGDFNNKFKFDQINFSQADLTLNINSSATIPVELNGTINASNGIQNNSLPLSNILMPSNSPVYLDLTNLFNGFSQKLPDRFSVEGTSLVNPNYELGSISRNDSVFGSVDFEIPLKVGITGGEITDTVEINFGDINKDDINKVNYGKVTLSFENEIPASLAFTGKVLNQFFAPVLELPPAYNSVQQIVIPAPQVDQNGNLLKVGQLTTEIELKGEDIQKFLDNPYLFMDLKFNTADTNGMPVKFKVNEKISFKIKAEAEYKVEL